MRIQSILISVSLAVLTACSQPEPAATPQKDTAATPPAPVVVEQFLPLTPETFVLERKAEKCKRECAQLRIESLRFPDNPALNTLLEKSLVSLTSSYMGEPDTSYEVFSRRFFSYAEKNWEVAMDAQLLRQTGPLLLFRLNSDIYAGGAHGMQRSQFLNVNRSNYQPLSLDDVVQDGKRPALWEKLRDVHRVWQDKEGYSKKDRVNWPFVESDNFALAEEGMVFGYSAYAIAPYSSGLPELTIPYTELGDILKPEWLLPAP